MSKLAVLAVVVAIAAAGCSSGHGITVQASFADVGDLHTYAPVMMADIKVGQVTNISLRNDQALVTMRIEPSAQAPEDVIARVRSTSLLGERVVDLVVPPGTSENAPLLRDGDTITHTETRPELEDLVSQGTNLLGPISASEIATLVDTGAQGFGGNGAALGALLGNFRTIIRGYAGHTDEIRSLIGSLNQLNTTLASHAAAQGLSLQNSAKALDMLRAEDQKLGTAIRALARLSVGARGILDAHIQQMSRFFGQMRVILGVLRSERESILGILFYAPMHNRNTQLVNYYEFNQVYQDFVICGFNDNPNDPARTCSP